MQKHCFSVKVERCLFFISLPFILMSHKLATCPPMMCCKRLSSLYFTFKLHCEYSSFGNDNLNIKVFAQTNHRFEKLYIRLIFPHGWVHRSKKWEYFRIELIFLINFANKIYFFCIDLQKFAYKWYFHHRSESFEKKCIDLHDVCKLVHRSAIFPSFCM